MRLQRLTEGAVDVARAEIMDVINRAANFVAREAATQGWPRPDVKFSDTSDGPAVVKVEAGRNAIFPEPQPVTISIYGDSNFRLELPETLAQRLYLQPIARFRTASDAVDGLGRIRQGMRAVNK